MLPSRIPPPNPLRVIFMGTAELACASLGALAGVSGVEVVGVVTQPDRPRGRRLRLQPPPVKEVALRHELPVYQPERARDRAFLETIGGLDPDLIVVAAYGQILPAALLELPRHGCLNVHASLLPKYRGASPIQAALLHGDSETGVTLMRMDEGLDTGDIVSMETVAIEPGDTAQTLHDKLAALGADLLVQTLPGYVSGEIRPRPQPREGASYAGKIEKADGLLDWSQPAAGLANRIRAFNPWPGAFVRMPACRKGKLLKIWRAEAADDPGSPLGPSGTVLKADGEGILVRCGAGALILVEVQPEGKRRMSAREFLAGHSLRAGDPISTD